MTGRLLSGRLRRFSVVALGLFAVFLATAELEHHDLICHLKTPQHCTACASSPLGPDPHSLTIAPPDVLGDAGRALCAPVSLSGTVLPARSSGRSPPAA
jgi:hypothetical protein